MISGRVPGCMILMRFRSYDEETEISRGCLMARRRHRGRPGRSLLRCKRCGRIVKSIPTHLSDCHPKYAFVFGKLSVRRETPGA